MTCAWPVKLSTSLAVLAAVLFTAVGMFVYCTLTQLKPSDTKNKTLEDIAPSTDFEVTRRRILSEMRDLWLYTDAELSIFRNLNEVNQVKDRSRRVLEEMAERKLSIVRYLTDLSSMDRLGEWRMKEAKDLQDIVQSRIHKLQNPQDCATAKKAVCDMKLRTCDYGCQINHVLSCLVMAYATNRTLILDSKGWNGIEEGWESLFQPPSKTCVNASGTTSAPWPGADDVQVLHIAHHEVGLQLNFMPPAIPQDLSERLIRLHGNPGIWWMGQLYKYLLRPKESFEKFLKEKEDGIRFKNPIIGVHVNRTEEVSGEGNIGNSLEDYMTYVEDQFRLIELETPGVKRQVYLATDQLQVYEESKNYSHYEFLGGKRLSTSNGNQTQKANTSFEEFVTDVHFLSRTDFIVCKFSSAICRIAYSLMQTYQPDASANFQSLDDIFYFAEQPEHLQKAVATHIPRDPSEIDLQVGDHIQISGNFWNGSSIGANKRTGKKGLYPSFKVIEILNVVPMGNYTESHKENFLNKTENATEPLAAHPA